MKKKDFDKLDDALFNRAIGFSKDEITEEYSMIEDKLTLVKKKLNSKYYPPELKAIELLMDKYNLNNNNPYDGFSLEELQNEKEKLVNMLKVAQEKQNKDDSKSNKKV